LTETGHLQPSARSLGSKYTQMHSRSPSEPKERVCWLQISQLDLRGHFEVALKTGKGKEWREKERDRRDGSKYPPQ